MDKKKIGAGFAGALQKAADAAKLAKLTVQDMTADAKQSRGKKAQQKADAQKVPASKDEPTAVEPPENAAPDLSPQGGSYYDLDDFIALLPSW